MEIIYRLHAVERMFERDILEEEVRACIENGEAVESYPDDRPYPSFLNLYTHNGRALHVVFAKDEDSVIVITVYEPDPTLWEAGFKIRKEKQ